MRSGSPRRGFARLAPIVALLSLAATACGEAERSESQELWVADNFVQCNEFDEPFRECLLVSHLEFGLYRHLEGPIEGFEFEEGTKYLLEVERTDAPLTSGEASYRLIDVLSTE